MDESGFVGRVRSIDSTFVGLLSVAEELDDTMITEEYLFEDAKLYKSGSCTLRKVFFKSRGGEDRHIWGSYGAFKSQTSATHCN